MLRSLGRSCGLDDLLAKVIRYNALSSYALHVMVLVSPDGGSTLARVDAAGVKKSGAQTLACLLVHDSTRHVGRHPFDRDNQRHTATPNTWRVTACNTNTTRLSCQYLAAPLEDL